MFRTVLRVPVGPAQPLLYLPRAEARRPLPRLGPTHNRLLHGAELRADVGGSPRRDAARGLEEGDALLEVGDGRPVLAAGILHEGVGCGHQHRGIDVQPRERAVRRVLVADQRLQRLRVPSQNRERRLVRRAPLRVPLAAVDVDVTARALDVDHVDAMRPQQGDVDLVELVPLLQFEVVNEGEGVRQVVAQVGDRLPLGVVDRLTDGDDLGHQTPARTSNPALDEGACFAFTVDGAMPGGTDVETRADRALQSSRRRAWAVRRPLPRIRRGGGWRNRKHEP